MSFGSLGANAVKALNLGAKESRLLAQHRRRRALPYHKLGADVIYQFARATSGAGTWTAVSRWPKLLETVSGCGQVRGIEIKLSQGAKPGKGGVLPGKKYREIRGDRAVRPAWRPGRA